MYIAKWYSAGLYSHNFSRVIFEYYSLFDYLNFKNAPKDFTFTIEIFSYQLANYVAPPYLITLLYR